MPVTYGGQTSSAATGTSLTYAFTVSGSDPYIAVGVSARSLSVTISSVTYDGNTLDTINKGTQGARLAGGLFGKEGLTGTSVNVVVTISVSGNIASGAMYFTGVDQTTPTGTAAQQAGVDTSTGALTVTSATDDIVVDVCAYEDTDQDSEDLTTSETGQTRRYINGISRSRCAGSTKAGETSCDVGWSWTDSDDYYHVGVSIQQVSGGETASVSEAPGHSDSVTGKAVALVSIGEQMGHRDVASAVAAAQMHIAELLGHSDLNSGAANAQTTINEQPGHSDSVEGSTDLAASVSEEPGHSDALVPVASAFAEVSEQPAHSDSVDGSTDLASSVSEQAGHSDAKSGAASAAGTVSEQPGFTDSVRAQGVAFVLVSEEPGHSDTVTGSTAELVTVSDQLGASDQSAAQAVANAIVTALAGASDSAQGLAAAVGLLGESVGLTSSQSGLAAAFASALESAGAADAYSFTVPVLGGGAVVGTISLYPAVGGKRNGTLTSIEFDPAVAPQVGLTLKPLN